MRKQNLLLSTYLLLLCLGYVRAIVNPCCLLLRRV
ncbi:unnamed protein product [Linum tenue]|uniref:Uncharacterized protein n=1 Tax=Linum tenue TaxID=586396 RepID=A0AAV0NP63_9ROSI|nr:unnamed protein product [Linum tenue]